jgi:hypothetical protein
MASMEYLEAILALTREKLGDDFGEIHEKARRIAGGKKRHQTEDKDKTEKAESPINILGYGYDSTLAEGPFDRMDVKYTDPEKNYRYAFCGACAFYSAGECNALEESVHMLASCDAYIEVFRELELRSYQFHAQATRAMEEGLLMADDAEIVEQVDKYISEEGGKYCVRSHQTGKNFGCYSTRAQAEKRLAQISRFKEAKFDVKFAAMDEDKQIVYGIVLEPDEVDSHGDTITMEEIEAAAHRYALTPMVIGDGHKKKAKARSVETFIYNPKVLEKVKEGSWVMAVKVNSKKLWEGVQSGDYTGFSIGALVKRRPFEDGEENK